VKGTEQLKRVAELFAIYMIDIATFSKPEEAHLLRMRLEAGGVAARIQDENMVQINWLNSNAIGGVRVQVPEDDLSLALEILRDEGVAFEPETMPACPQCGSTDTSADELPRRLAFLSILLMGFPLLFGKRRLQCGNSNHVWNGKLKKAG
jgi:hypothetical protein